MAEQKRDQPEQRAGRATREPYYEGYFGTEEEEGAVRLQDDAEAARERTAGEGEPAPRKAGAEELPPGETIIDPARRNPEAPANTHDSTPSGEDL